jgi:hypothetical protein
MIGIGIVVLCLLPWLFGTSTVLRGAFDTWWWSLMNKWSFLSQLKMCVLKITWCCILWCCFQWCCASQNCIKFS